MSDLKDLMLGEMRYDEFVGTKFGSLVVVGWNGLTGNAKRYILTCDICSEDKELHGEGFFAMTKGHLERGGIPCGCSSKCNWTEEQYKIRAIRACEHKGIAFLGWDKFINANRTKVNVLCPEHGEYHINLSALLDLEQPKGCRGCFAIRMGNYKRKSDEDMIAQFMATACYHPDTKFWRSERLDKNGHKKYWYIHCPVCNETSEGHIVGLLKGSLSCSCSPQAQKQAYINLVKDGDNIIALKYGVSKFYKTRVDSQNCKSIYNIENFGVWKFTEVMSCKEAERECSHSFDRGIISKEELPDGHTETTYPHNLEKIIEIYESYGGVRLNG